MTENKSLDQLPLLESPSADAELYVIQSGIDYRVKHSALGGLSPLQYNRIWIGDISGQSTTLTTSAIGRALITAEDAEAGRDALDVYSREFWDTLADESTRLTGFGRPRGVVIETDAANRRVSVTVDRPVRWRNQVLDDFQVGVPWLSPQWDEPVDPCGVLYLAYDGTNYTWFESFPGFGNMLIALVYFNDTCTFHYGTRECHGFMDPDAHRGDHFAVGSYIRADGGGDLDDFVVASTTAANRRPSVDALEMWDEDVPTELPALPSGSYTHFRLSGANADATFAPTQGDIVGLVSGVPQRNIFSGGVWTTQDFGTNHYGTVWALAVPVTADSASQAYRFLWIQPQSSGTLTSQRALSPNDVSLGQYGEVSPEFVFFAKIIIRRQGANWTLQSVERISGNRAQQVTSPTAAGLSSVNADEDYFEGLGTPTSELTLRQASPTTGIIPDRLKITQHNLVIGDADTRGSLLATGEKGRALIGLADDAALQAEILARLVDTTIVGTKLEATSTDADSIKTAGSIQALGSTLSEFSSSGNTEISISGGNGNTSSLNLSTGIGNAGRRWFLRRGIESETGSDAGSPFQIWARNDAGDAIDVPLEITRASNQPINLRRITNVLGGTTPAAQSAANAAIGNGTVRAGTQLRSDGTATDSIRSAGGIVCLSVASRATDGSNYDTTTIDDWSLTLRGAHNFGIKSGQTLTITGLEAPASTHTRLVLRQYNTGTLVLKHDDTGSLSGNRFSMIGSADITVTGTAVIVLDYILSVWMVSSILQ